jgi:transcriptional regulator with XRE-family HTH domain
VPAKAPDAGPAVAAAAARLGGQIRERRKALGVSATAAAESAGMSRVTWYRLEQGELSVTLGAYLAAWHVLGMDLRAIPAGQERAGPEETVPGLLPVRIPLAQYPQLQQLAWQVHGADTVSPREALGIYERNWRHLDLDRLEPQERGLIETLRAVFEAGPAHV